MSAYDHYRQHTNGWGTNQMRFGPPPSINFQPQPHWGGYDYFRAHANSTPDPNLWQHAFRRINSDSMLNSLGVGLRDARTHHHRAFGGLGNMQDMSPQELGHAAAYEAYRLWIHNSQLYEPLGADPHRQKEALVGLAIAEATKLYEQSPMRMDHQSRYPAIEAAAATAAVLFQDVLAREGMGSMGSMGGRGRSASPMGRGISSGSAYGGAGAGYGGGNYGGAGAYGAGGSPYLGNVYHADYDAPWFAGRHSYGHSSGYEYGAQRPRRGSHSGYDMNMPGMQQQPPSPIQMAGRYPRPPSPYNVAGAPGSQGGIAYPGRSPSPYNIAPQGAVAYPGRSPSPYNVAPPSPIMTQSYSHGSHDRRSPSPYRSGHSHHHVRSHSHNGRRSPSPMRVQQVLPQQQQLVAAPGQTPLVLDSSGRPYRGANVYQQNGHTVIELPSKHRSSSSKHHHHGSSSRSGHEHTHSHSHGHSHSHHHRSRSSDPAHRIVYRV